MLDEATRTAIFKLHEQGHGSRAIAQALKVARATVRQVIRSGHRTVPPLLRAERATTPDRHSGTSLFPVPMSGCRWQTSSTSTSII